MRTDDPNTWVMGAGRHAVGGRRRRGRAVSILLVSSLALAGLAGGTAYAGYRYDRNRIDRILPGIRIAGVDVGGMTRAEAERALRPAIAEILDRRISIQVVGKSWDLNAGQLGTTVSAERALDGALAVTTSMSWTSRLSHRLLNKPVERSFALDVAYHQDVVARFVNTVGRTVQAAPSAASLDFVDGRLVIQHSTVGRALAGKAAIGSLMGALTDGLGSVTFSTRPVQPSVTDQTLGMTIIIRLSQNRLYLYDGLKLAKTYPVATGQPKYPTPTGHWTIVNKRVNPTWYNPAKDTWGANEPDFIPPGPDNPLGTRALDLDAPGIRIHGTPDDASIGHYASHGCIRMHIPDSEQLFALVSLGTPVIIAF